MKLLRAAAVAVMTAASLICAAAPAQAADDPSPVSWWIESQVNLGCLGSTGTSVFVGPCDGFPPSVWIERALDRRSNWGSGLCLADGPGTTVLTETCSESTRQGWIHDPIGNGLVQLRNRATGQCLDTNGVKVYTSPCGNVADIGIKWRIKRVFGG